MNRIGNLFQIAIFSYLFVDYPQKYWFKYLKISLMEQIYISIMK